MNENKMFLKKYESQIHFKMSRCYLTPDSGMTNLCFPSLLSTDNTKKLKRKKNACLPSLESKPFFFLFFLTK